jgi:hypothetical protein
MTQWLVTCLSLQARVPSQAILEGIYDEQSDTGTGFLQVCWFSSVSLTVQVLYLSLMLYNHSS